MSRARTGPRVTASAESGFLPGNETLVQRWFAWLINERPECGLSGRGLPPDWVDEDPVSRVGVLEARLVPDFGH